MHLQGPGGNEGAREGEGEGVLDEQNIWYTFFVASSCALRDLQLLPVHMSYFAFWKPMTTSYSSQVMGAVSASDLSFDVTAAARPKKRTTTAKTFIV